MIINVIMRTRSAASRIGSGVRFEVMHTTRSNAQMSKTVKMQSLKPRSFGSLSRLLDRPV